MPPLLEDHIPTSRQPKRGAVMAEDNDENASAKAAKNGDAPASDLAVRVIRTLRRARKARDSGDDDEASYYLREANVLAVMDVAEAVRESTARNR
jgi:hypothetical protein